MKISHKPVLLAAALAITVVACFAQFDPTFRYANFGTTWAYEPIKGKEERLLLTLNAAEGREVRGQDVGGVVPLAEAGKFEAFLDEVCQSRGSEMLYDYQVKQVRSEQFDWNQPTGSKLSTLRWSTRILQRGPLVDFTLNDKSSSLWSRHNIGAGWLFALWPGLPPGRIRLGKTWSRRIQTTCTAPELPEGFPVRYKADYRWDLAHVTNGHTILEYSWTGSIDGLEGTQASGQMTGAGVFSLDEGKVMAAEFHNDLEARHALSMPGSEASNVGLAVHQTESGRIVREQRKPGEETATPAP